jgi:hypothetical protein
MLDLFMTGARPVLKDPDSLKQRAEESERDARKGDNALILGVPEPAAPDSGRREPRLSLKGLR